MSLIGIIGRQNVGKSTLFNALINQRKSITYDFPGVTRDLISEKISWDFKNYELVDFPGFENPRKLNDRPLDKMSLSFAMDAISNYKLLLWVLKFNEITSFELDLARKLHQKKILTWIIINFTDNEEQISEFIEWRKLGFKRVFFISAIQKKGLLNLRNQIINQFSCNAIQKKLEPTIKLALFGKPNVGKSTLFNYLLKKQRSLVSDIAGTTRDPVSEQFKFRNYQIEIIDTAGLRKNNNKDKIEFFSTTRTKISLSKADVGILLVDATDLLDRQIKNLLNLAKAQNTPIILVLNKIDLLKEENQHQKKLHNQIDEYKKSFWNFPVFYISALSGKKTHRILESAIYLKEKKTIRISTSHLNKLIKELSFIPILNKIKILYCTQKSPKTSLIIFINKVNIEENVKKFIIREFQKKLNWMDLPMEVEFRYRPKKN